MRLDRNSRHRGFYLALGVGVLAFVVAGLVRLELALPIGADAFFVAYLALAAVELPRLTPAFLRRNAGEQDAPAPLILGAMLLVVLAAVGSLVVAMVGSDTGALQLVLAMISVVLGWFAINTMWAMHYAYRYYHPRGNAKDEVQEGLEFPGNDAPDATTFLYFAFVVGMTAQTSDTAVTSNHMRRIVTLHGIFAYFFNTVLVAAAVNVVVTMAR